VIKVKKRESLGEREKEVNKRKRLKRRIRVIEG
jgi:hypothetical protein